MKKKLFRAAGLIVLAAIVLVLSLWPVVASADISPACRFYGPVTLDGKSVPSGTTVTGWIDGCSAGPWSVNVFYQGATYWYALDIPANTGSGGTKNGGVNGDMVHLKVTVGGSDIQGASGIFQKTTNIYLPQSLTTPVGPVITTASLPDGTVGVAGYAVTMAATSGTGSYTWSATGLPNGLSISSSGVISGKAQPAISDYGKFSLPSLNGAYNPIFTVTDSAGHSDNKSIPLNIKWIKADANGDGVVTVADVTKVELIILGKAARTPGADANGDGKVDVADVTKTELIILGKG